MKDVQSLATELAQFTGTENWYRHNLVRHILYTDGVQFLAEKAGSYWLIDQIALSQKYEKAVAAEPFQLWKLTVSVDRPSVLACEDGNGKIVLQKEIEFTDFPLPEIKLYCTDNTILLPSEY